jgi:hypothetical protein
MGEKVAAPAAKRFKFVKSRVATMEHEFEAPPAPVR